jgi:hypothetical protein
MALFLSASALLLPQSVQADVISRNNPYRSFNISGVNYGSLRWEQQNRKSTKKATARPARILRWRAR